MNRRLMQRDWQPKRPAMLGPVDKPVLAPAQPERLGRCNTDVATGVTR